MGILYFLFVWALGLSAWAQCTISTDAFSEPVGGFIPATVIYNVNEGSMTRNLTRVFATRVDTVFPINVGSRFDTLDVKFVITKVVVNKVVALPQGATLDLNTCNVPGCTYNLDTSMAASLGQTNRGCMTLTGNPTFLGTFRIEVGGDAEGYIISPEPLRAPQDVQVAGFTVLPAGTVVVPANTPLSFNGQCQGCNPLLPLVLPLLLPEYYQPRVIASTAYFRLRVINATARLEDQLTQADVAVVANGNLESRGTVEATLYGMDRTRQLNWQLHTLDGRTLEQGQLELEPNRETRLTLSHNLSPGLYVASFTDGTWQKAVKVLVN